MYCHPDFKKMIDIKRIELGGGDSIAFTKKLANNPELIKGEKNVKKKTFKTPRLF